MHLISLGFNRAQWLTSNDRLHRMDAAKRVAATRARAAAAATQYRLMHGAITRPADLAVMVRYPTARRADPPNTWPTVKAMIDGIVDARVLEDDDHSHVPSTSFHRGPNMGATGAYLITIYAWNPSPLHIAADLESYLDGLDGQPDRHDLELILDGEYR